MQTPAAEMLSVIAYWSTSKILIRSIRLRTYSIFLHCIAITEQAVVIILITIAISPLLIIYLPLHVYNTSDILAHSLTFVKANEKARLDKQKLKELAEESGITVFNK